MPDGEVPVLGWSPLLRRILRVLVGLGVRQVVRHGRRAARARRDQEAGERHTIIDVERVDTDQPFERFSEPARRIVARAADRDSGTSLTHQALLLTLIDTDETSAGRLISVGAQLHSLRTHLEREVAASAPPDGLTPAARRALRRAPHHADRRGVAQVEPRDLLAALLEQNTIARTVDRHSAGALGPPDEER